MYAELSMSLLWVRICASFTRTLITLESSRYWPRLPIAMPFPPWQVIYCVISNEEEVVGMGSAYILDKDVI
jgi:hypothetical protein